MYLFNSLKAYQNVRCLSSAALVCAKNHYDSLGITPKATQADVKGAYYKLSMIYHPDKNEGSDNAAQKFRDITDAYEVLGNVRLRKLYDRGVSHIGVGVTEDHPTTQFYKSRERRTRPPSTGSTPIYDFDEWSRSHYGATFARDMERRRKMEFRKTVDYSEKLNVQTARLLGAMGALFGSFLFIAYNTENPDNVTYVIRDEIKNQND